MNEELQLALSQLIEKSMVGVEKSVDFLSAEIPDVIYQLLMWYGVESALYTLLGLVLLVALYFIDKKLYKMHSEAESYSELTMIIPMFGGIFNIVIFFISTRLINLTWLQIWIAPKVWLLDYATNFVK